MIIDITISPGEHVFALMYCDRLGLGVLATLEFWGNSVHGLQAGDDGVTNMVFCIGGPYGHDETVRQCGNSMISLSTSVLNHQVNLSCSRASTGT